jgi:Ca-activated chloride channel family protein
MKLGLSRERRNNTTNLPSSPARPVATGPRSAWLSKHARLGLLLALVLAVGGPGATPAAAQEATVGPAALEAHSESGASQLLPLVNETITARIDDGHATVTYDHAFQNESKTQVEGTYRLAVGEGATATGFSYWNGEERIVGEIFERESAREVYEAMTGLRRDPGLLEQAGEGGFSFRVFPIAPGEKKRIQVTTARWLPVKDGAIEYRVRLAQPSSSISIQLRDARGASSLESPTHDIAIETKGDATFVRAGALKGKDEGEFVLRYKPAEAPLSFRAAEHRDVGQDGFVALTLRTPPRSPSTPPRQAHDVTLVLDRSGSMSGGAIEAAKSAARRVVSRLDEHDAVNVIVFDDKVDALYEKPRSLDSATRHEVDSYLGRVQVRGGTDIGGALKRALESQTKDARPDVVFFLTDGQSDGPAAIHAAEADSSDTRVFTVGLGEGVDKALLAKIASMRKGRFAFVADARAVEVELPRLVAQLEAPVLTDLHLRGDGTTLERTYPETLPDLFVDDELRVFTRAKSGGKVVLEAKQNGVPRVFEAKIDGAVAPRPWVGRSWAQARVDDLLGAQRGGGGEEKMKAIDDEIVDLGLAFELVTPRTSFLAIPEKEMTAAARDATASMRERKAKILAAHKDAAALSRLNMPPGDPILRVHAPRNAKRVTAMFPFGLTLDLVWDEFTEQWSTRFLVPKDVADGSYEVPVVIVHADDRVEATSVTYTIDASEPTLTVDARPVRGGVMLRVSLDEPAIEARAVRVGFLSSALTLTPRDARTFEGTLTLPPGHHRLRIVAADQARNEREKEIEVEVKP